MPAPAGWALTHVSGVDARDFLQRITTVDLRKLGSGDGRPGFILEPTGRIRAAFHLWCLGPDEFAVETESEDWTRRLTEALEHYHFGEKLSVAPMPKDSLASVWALGDGPAPATLAAVSPNRTEALDDEIRVFHHGSSRFGRPWITAWGRPMRIAQWADHTMENVGPPPPGALVRLRVEALGPVPGRELTPEVNPLEAGAQEGVAEGKGCYPGQEVIEKLFAFAEPARRLVRLRLGGPPTTEGEPVLNLAEPPLEVGRITTVEPVESERPYAALAVMKKIHAREGLEVHLGSGARGTVEALSERQK
ncbi:MAG: hypothetical protein IT285_10890 [Bdellovibrionales bacterium]|nr:hypothetical protein [Bdellovibrionales bacterium]